MECLLKGILCGNFSVDQASLPPLTSTHRWIPQERVSIVLNPALPSERWSMGKFALVSKVRDHLKAVARGTPSQEDQIFREIHFLLEGGARLPAYQDWVSSSKLELLFGQYH